MVRRGFPLTRGIALVLWRRLPDAAARVSTVLRMALRDGDYLLSWPLVASAAPPAALALGLLLGAAHPGQVFAASVPVVLILAALGGLGAAPGLYALVGFAVGDLALHTRASVSASDTILRTDAAALDAYLVLAGLVVVAPLVATAVRQRGQRPLRPGTPRLVAGFGLAALVQAALAYLWCQAVPPLLRPVWSFWNGTPDAGALTRLQRDGVWVAIVTLLAVAGRGALTALAARHPLAPAAAPRIRFRLPRPLPWPVAVALSAGVFTLLLAGLVDSSFGAALVFVIFAVLGAVRYRVVPRMGGYARVVDRVPILVRVAACCLVGYLAAIVVVRPAVARGGTSFVPVLLALVPALLLAAFLLPPRTGDANGRGR